QRSACRPAAGHPARQGHEETSFDNPFGGCGPGSRRVSRSTRTTGAGGSPRYHLELSPLALRDLEEIGLYIATDSPLKAERFVARIHDRLGRLTRFPTAYGIAPEADAFDIEIRQMIIRPYRALFVIEFLRVRVLRVIHGARLPLGPGSPSYLE